MPSLLYLALSNAILATVLAAFVAVVTRCCRRPAVRHALWLLVLLKLITPPLLPLAVTWPPSEESEPPPESMLPIGAAIVRERLEAPLPDSRGSESIGAATVRERPSHAQPPPPLPDGRGSDYSPILIAVWLGGALAWWTVAAVRLRKFRRLLRQARPATADVQEQGRRLAALLGLRRCPPIVFVSAPLSPMLWALGLSPRLLVPAELWHKLAAEQQDTLLVHELAHLRRGDQWVRRLELLILGLYWWHPVVWWARRRLQEAEEECCDALVVALLPDAAPAYAAALVETVAFLSQSRPAALVGASGAGQVPLLKRRLTMILTETSPRKPSRIGFWIVLIIGSLLLPLAPRAARTEAPENSQDTKTTSQPVSPELRLPDGPLVAKPVGVSDEMRNCISCHVMPVRGHDDFHDKPRDWREAHDEIVRLMDELHRRQAEFQTATNRPPAVAEPDRSEEIEKLQDEIELLKVRVRIKEARVSGTKAMLNEYRRRYKNLQETNRAQQGAIPRDTLEETRLQATTQETQLQINEAELQESQIRLKQAERRLARLQPPKPRSAPVKLQSPERLQELEKKLDELRKEIDNLRREMRPKESRDPEQECRELRGFIVFVWPTLDTTRLEENIPKAQKAFQMCKAAHDLNALRKLHTGTKEHADRLTKELANLRPELVIEDEKQAQKIKKVHEQIVKLGRELRDYLMPAPLGR